MTSPRRLLSRHGLAAHKGRGQNFLADPGLAELLVKRAGLEPGTLVLEVGPGLGALTRPLLEAGCRVIAVEVDRGLAQYLRDEVLPQFLDSLTVIQEDVLETDLTGLARAEGRRLIVVGNLPFQISTPFLLKLLEDREATARAVLTFQKELAQRLTAEPRTKSYGRLSVLFGYYAVVERLMDLGPEAFHPRPKVGSTVLGLVFKNNPRPPLVSPSLFRQVVAAGFSRRRKTLKNALRSAFSALEAEAALEAAGIDPGRRAETLTIEEFAALANAMV